MTMFLVASAEMHRPMCKHYKPLQYTKTSLQAISICLMWSVDGLDVSLVYVRWYAHFRDTSSTLQCTPLLANTGVPYNQHISAKHSSESHFTVKPPS